jgi:hypothetical protein
MTARTDLDAREALAERLIDDTTHALVVEASLGDTAPSSPSRHHRPVILITAGGSGGAWSCRCSKRRYPPGPGVPSHCAPQLTQNSLPSGSCMTT